MKGLKICKIKIAVWLTTLLVLVFGGIICNFANTAGGGINDTGATQTLNTEDCGFENTNISTYATSTPIALNKSSDGYYLIESASQLHAIDNGFVCGSETISEQDALTKNYRLVKDIEFTSSSPAFKPIGYRLKDKDETFSHIEPFKGVFDGNGHSIIGMTLKNNTSIVEPSQDPNMTGYIYYWRQGGPYIRRTVALVGLFGRVDGAVIKNLQILNPTINVQYKGYVEDGYHFLYTNAINSGIVVAEAAENGCTMQNISVTGYSAQLAVTEYKNLRTSSYESYQNVAEMCVGGLIGVCKGNLNITNCSFTKAVLNVTCKTAHFDASYMPVYVGGLVGKTYSKDILNSTNITGAEMQGTIYVYNGFYEYNWGVPTKRYINTLCVGGLIGISISNVNIANSIVILSTQSNWISEMMGFSDTEYKDATEYVCAQPILGENFYDNHYYRAMYNTYQDSAYNTHHDPEKQDNVQISITNCYYNESVRHKFMRQKGADTLAGVVDGSSAKQERDFYGTEGLQIVNG